MQKGEKKHGRQPIAASGKLRMMGVCIEDGGGGEADEGKGRRGTE